MHKITTYLADLELNVIFVRLGNGIGVCVQIDGNFLVFSKDEQKVI